MSDITKLKVKAVHGVLKNRLSAWPVSLPEEIVRVLSDVETEFCVIRKEADIETQEKTQEKE